MHNRLATLREKRENGENGFTLIELLVVVVIIGILIAIAIPLYLNYKKGANDKSAESDLRGGVSALEQCNADNGAYPKAVPATGGTITKATQGCDATLPVTSGTTLAFYPVSATDQSNYIMSSTNSNGSGKFYCYASAAGGSVKTEAAKVTAYAAACK